MHDIFRGEFEQNIARVRNLVTVYNALEQNDVGDSEARKDVLRAAAVFLHSTLEEMIRNLYIWRLPSGTQDNLNKIPFIGHAVTRPKGILLGELREFADRFISNVIQDSIENYVNSMNLNNTTQLSLHLDMVGIQPDIVRQHFNLLDQLMQRRHQIVHQMDRQNSLDPLDDPVTDISVQSVVDWMGAVDGFFHEILEILPSS